MIKTFYDDTIKPFIKILLTIIAFLLALFINNLNAKLDDVYTLLLELKVSGATVTQQVKSIELKEIEQDLRIERVETKIDKHLTKDK